MPLDPEPGVRLPVVPGPVPVPVSHGNTACGLSSAVCLAHLSIDATQDVRVIEDVRALSSSHVTSAGSCHVSSLFPVRDTMQVPYTIPLSVRYGLIHVNHHESAALPGQQIPA